MATTNKPFHTYENVGYDDQPVVPSNCNHFVPQQTSISTNTNTITTPTTGASTTTTTTTTNGNTSGNNGIANNTAISVNKTAIESPFGDPMLHDSSIIPNPAATTRVLSTTDSGTTHMLTSRTAPGQNLVTKLITLPAQSPMDSFKEWSVSTFKCTKQLINERRGICSITNDAQLRADIEQLRDSRNKLVQMLRTGVQMTNHYSQLVKTQKQLHGLMNEMSIKCFTGTNSNSTTTTNNNNINGTKPGKQIIANFSSLSNNLSSSTTTSSPTHRPNTSDNLDDFLPVLNHMRSSNLNLVDDFKRNAISLNIAIKNGEKLVAALNYYCSNLSTLINKTIEDTLLTVKQYESARLEYDAERNSLHFITPTAQTSMTYPSDKLELARIRYEQLKEDVQIKMKFLEENTIKVMHKQLLLFNGAFASYTSGDSAALDATLRQFSIR